MRDIQQEKLEASDKVLTAPNVITCCRLMLVPLFVYLRFFTIYQTAALVVFAVAACTDWIDGQVARRTGQVSKLGKVLDPLVDRVLLATGVISVCVEGNLPLWIVVLGVVLLQPLFLLLDWFFGLCAAYYTDHIRPRLIPRG